MRLLLILSGFPFLLVPSFAKPKSKELGYPQLGEQRIQVVFPENYDPSKKWPAVFYYHGTNGKPSADLVRIHTGDQDWFAIGMAYVQRGAFTYSEESLNKELEILRSTRKYLADQYNLDPTRCYVAGFSKGGWITDYLLQRDRSLAGGIILGAGHYHAIVSRPLSYRNRKPIFIGVGRLDGNWVFGLRAVTFHRKLGATTTLDTWDDLGHQFPKGGSDALRQWLTIELRPDDNHSDRALEWSEERLGEIKTMQDPVDQWLAVRAMQTTPFFHILDENRKAELAEIITKLEKDEAVSKEAQALTRHRQLLRREVGRLDRRSFDELRAAYSSVQTGYRQIAEQFEDTRQGKLAASDAERVGTLLLNLDEQERLAKEEAAKKAEEKDDPFAERGRGRTDSRGRGFPLNPLVR